MPRQAGPPTAHRVLWPLAVVTNACARVEALGSLVVNVTVIRKRRYVPARWSAMIAPVRRSSRTRTERLLAVTRTTSRALQQPDSCTAASGPPSRGSGTPTSQANVVALAGGLGACRVTRGAPLPGGT